MVSGGVGAVSGCVVPSLTPGDDFSRRAETTGYSVVQMIETSSVVGHFSEGTNTIYLDIFSCKPYDQQKVCDFCRGFFEAESVVEHFIERK